jgi:two-component system secretion system response regulator SalR
MGEPIHRLTGREKEIIELLAREGCREKDAAQELGISHRTVANHTRDIRIKLGVRSTKDAVLKALRMGIISI